MMERVASKKPIDFKEIHSKFKDNMRELSKSAEKENMVQKFEKDIVGFFKYNGRKRDLIKNFVKEYGPFFKKEIKKIDKNISKNNLDWIVRLHMFGTIAKNVRNNNIDFSAKNVEKALPKLLLLTEGFGVRQAIRVPRNRQQKFYNFLVGRVRKEKMKTDEAKPEKEEKGTDQYAGKHIAFKSNLIGYLDFDEGELEGAKGEFKKEIMETIQKKELPFFRDDVLKKKIDKKISPEDAIKLLRFYTCGSLISLIRKKMIDVPEDRLERLVYEIFESK